MIARYNRKSLAIGIPGLLLQIACTALPAFWVAYATSHGSEPPHYLVLASLPGVLIGDVLLILGLCYYSKAKGYTALLGLLGLLSCLGLLILAVLPDKTKGQTDEAV